MTKQFRPRSRWFGSTILACALFASFAVQVCDAAPVVKRSADGVRIEAREAKVQEVLALLERDFGVQYRTSISLDRMLSGAYEGPLLRVLGRVLRGYDYVITTRQGVIEVVILSLERSIETKGVVQPPGGPRAGIAAPGSAVPDRSSAAVVSPAAAAAEPPPSAVSGRGQVFAPPDGSTAARTPVPPAGVSQVAVPGSSPPPPPAVETSMMPVSPLPGALRPGQR